MADDVRSQSLKKQFQDLNSLLAAISASLPGSGAPSSIASDLAQVSQALKAVEHKVGTQLSQHQSQLGALMGVGQAINSSLGLKQVLEQVMDALIRLMQAERGFLMLKETHGDLSVQTARGMAQVNLEEEAFAISRTIIRRVAETGEPVLTTNAQEDPRFGKQMSIAAYHLRSILCAPLKLKDELIGVIYVDHRGMSGMFAEGDLGIISAFADQAAVAIDNARLFDRLKAANEELETAYDATLKGWVRALDLRDKETEGHTQRVTQLTVRLARAMGVEGESLVHIERGALLHDIGKMAIPDSILLKPGDLTPEERALVKQHPTFAYEMLRPIQFLLPALDIPHCHHEKWDGSGYPRGLKEVAIPFAARIFSVVDVWDALVSDRPYRKGMKPDEVRGHIREHSGSYFDPRVVDAFLNLKNLSVEV
ncbi:MAG: HD domain-containing phosphohydrolase [Chloroflexota bacterium]